MKQSPSINYIEFPAKYMAATKQFFKNAFNWQLTDYGDRYCAFDKSAGLDGGFYQSDQCSTTENGSMLVVFHCANLSTAQLKITEAGGEISQEIFEFPGGKRFHFLDPNGNEFAVWSE